MSWRNGAHGTQTFLRLERGESAATLAHRISLLRISWGEVGRRSDEVSPGSGEELKMRALVSNSSPLIEADER